MLSYIQRLAVWSFCVHLTAVIVGFGLLMFIVSLFV